MVGGVLVITVVFGIVLAMLLDQPMWGQGMVRILDDRAVFRDAYCVCTRVEEHDDGPGERHFCPPLAVLSASEPVAWLAGCLAQLYRHDRVMAVAAFCHLDPAHSNPVAGQ